MLLKIPFKMHVCRGLAGPKALRDNNRDIRFGQTIIA